MGIEEIRLFYMGRNKEFLVIFGGKVVRRELQLGVGSSREEGEKGSFIVVKKCGFVDR